MTSRRFLIFGLGLILACAGATAGVARWLNFYGQFGDVRGAAYVPQRPNERVAKYLFAHNYIPSNFDALLVGSSSAVNWDTHGVSGYRMYNLSMSGANAADEKILVETVLRRGHIRLVAFVINSYLTGRHGPTTGEMVPRQRWSSLGSPQLLIDMALRFAARRGKIANDHDAYGTEDFTQRPGPADLATQMRLAAEGKLPNHERGREFAIDPLALTELRDTIETARRHGALVVLIHPAMYRGRWDAVAAEYAAFRAEIDPLFGPSVPILDFNTDRYAPIRDDLGSFYDHVHFSRAGAAASVVELDRFLRMLPAR